MAQQVRDKKLWDDRTVLSEVLQASPIPQFVIDNRHLVVFWNRALEEYTGLRSVDMVGTREQWRAFYPEERPCLADLLVEGTVDQIAAWYSGKYNKSRLIEDAYEATDFFPHIRGGTWLYFTAAPIRGHGGEIIGALETLEDVTERKQAEQALKSAKDQAELYLDLIGHDINNLNQIGIGYLEIALDQLRLGPAERGLLAKPLEVLRDSSRLISNVRKIQEAQAGQARPEPVDLGKVLSEVVQEYRSVPDRQVSIEYEPVTNICVMANALLKDVFANIISNAVKHSRGPVAVNVEVGRISWNGKCYYQVAVEDNGPGIPDELKGALFDQGRHVHTAKGHGLGLYLVKTLVDSYGGEIWVEDRAPGYPEKGARFVVLLPAME